MSTFCRRAPAAPSTPSAAPGARLRICIWRRPAIRCMSCTAIRIRAKEALEFCKLVHRVQARTVAQIEVISNARRPLLGYAALVLEHVIRRAKPKDIVVSALGVREGLLYSLLDPKEREAGCADRRRAKSQCPALALAETRRRTDRLDRQVHGDVGPRRNRGRETIASRRVPARRYRLACASGLSRRAIAQHHLPCRFRLRIDHPGPRVPRAVGVLPACRAWRRRGFAANCSSCTSKRLLDLAQILGAALRVAYMVSASMPGVLPNTPLRVERGKLVLRMKGKFAALAGDRVGSRLKQLAKLIGYPAKLMTG